MKKINFRNSAKRIWRWWWRWRYWRWGGYFILWIIWLNCLPKQLFDEPTSTVLYDQNGHLLGATIASDGQWRFPYNAHVPEKFKTCIIEFEDRTFESHWGVSLRGLTRATMQNIESGSIVSGGSTLTMQLMRMSGGNDDRTIWNKVVEIFQATRAEWRYDKNQILAMYASNAPMGGNVVGVDAAAWRYFGKSAAELSWAESATLAVLPNAPSLIHPGKNRNALLQKRNRLLQRLYDQGKIDHTTYELSIEEPLPEEPYPIPQVTPHVLQWALRNGKAGTIIHTTIDRSIQKMTQEVVALHHMRLQQNEINNIAVLVMETKTGKVSAYVGNTADTTEEHQPYVDVIQARRSSGSILKPLLYQAMLEEGMITPEQWVEDVPTYFPGYVPKNYSNTFDGLVPADEAISRSLNVPTIHMLMEYGTAPFLNRVNRLGLKTLDRTASNYGLSLILGGGEVTLWDLVNVYGKLAQRMLGNEEVENAHVFKDQQKSERNNFDRGAIWWMMQAMVDVARPDEEKQWEMFSSAQKIAWKTGTSFGFRDAWSVGISPDYVVGVWVGNADGEGRPGIVGGKVAAPILFDVFSGLQGQSKWFETPFSEMEQIEVCALTGFKASEYCHKKRKQWVPIRAAATPFCTYHKKYYLNPKSLQRVNSSCFTMAEAIDTSMLTLNPMVAQYYEKNHPSYQKLPPVDPKCQSLEEENTIAFIYPKKESRVYLPINIQGELEKMVAEASLADNSKTLYWYLDEFYYGKTKDIHQIEMRPEAGEHTITVVDEKGQKKELTFEVLERRD